MAQLVVIAATAAIGYALSQPEIKLWLPGLPPIEFDNPLFRTREGARLGSLQIQETAEGAPDNRCFGRKNRVAGALVWMSDLKEVKKSESGGGKGGGGGEFITYQYFANVIVRLCRAVTPINRIPRLWADSKLLFDDETDVDVSSNGIDTKVENPIVYIGVNQLNRYRLVLESDISVAGRPDLSELKSGNLATVSGYTGGTLATNLQLIQTPTIGSQIIRLQAIGTSVALLVDDVIEFAGSAISYSVQTGITVTTGGTNVTVRNTIAANRPVGSGTSPLAALMRRGNQINNGTFTVTASSKDPDPTPPQIARAKLTDQSNPYRLFQTIAIGPTVTVRQTQAPFKASQVGSVEMLLGGPEQSTPATLQQFEGNEVSQVYAMRNRAGVVLVDLNLTDFGNRVPNVEGEVATTQDNGQVADVIRAILVEDVGLPESAVDVSMVSGTFIGFSIRNPQAPNRSLQALMLAHDVVRWESGGVIRFANRSAIPVTTIPASVVGAYDGEQAKRSLVVRDPSSDKLPSEVNVRYRSATNDLQEATKRGFGPDDAPIDVRSVDLGGLVIEDEHAQQIADRLIAVAWGAQRSVTIPLPPSYVGKVRSGMVLEFGPIYGQTWRVFVDRVDRGANGLLVAQGIEYDPELLQQFAVTEGTLGLSASGNTQDGAHTAAGPADLHLMDIPAISDQHRTEPGIYIAAEPADYSRPWRGAVLYWSRDAGSSWNRVADVLTEAACGILVTAPATDVLPDLWDRANTIRIKVRHRQVQLGSVTEDACLAGANRFLVGREIIGAAQVTFVSIDPVDGARTYDLSVLLRGLQDTDQSIDEHVAGEDVVWLDGPGVQFIPLSLSHVDAPRLWRLVPNGGFVEDAEPIELAPSARNCRPYHVRDAKATRDGSNNITLAWERTSRAVRTFLEQTEPLDEESERYEIDVVVGGAVKRTISVTGARTASHTAAQQSADGIVPGNPVLYRFYQLSTSLLRGQQSVFTL